MVLNVCSRSGTKLPALLIAARASNFCRDSKFWCWFTDRCFPLIEDTLNKLELCEKADVGNGTCKNGVKLGRHQQAVQVGTFFLNNSFKLDLKCFSNSDCYLIPRPFLSVLPWRNHEAVVSWQINIKTTSIIIFLNYSWWILIQPQQTHW